MSPFFGNVYQDKRVLVTGHTGFKGSWLCLWLQRLGAVVKGFALPPNTKPSHYELLQLPMEGEEGDLRDAPAMRQAIEAFNPNVIFHLAAQPIVRYGYSEPVETIETNINGSLHLYETCRNLQSLEAVVAISTDKVYRENPETEGYRETDPLGGHDPYSASKAAMEVITTSYRNSFFNQGSVLLASARAGNVIGGGDWGQDRLLPDLYRATVEGQTTLLRNSQFVRPWQHVLEPLSGYLLLGQRLLEKHAPAADAFNFGPGLSDNTSVEEVITLARQHWPEIRCATTEADKTMPEAQTLRLNCEKAKALLDWSPVWDLSISVRKTIIWYKTLHEENAILSKDDLEQYLTDASEQKQVWTLQS